MMSCSTLHVRCYNGAPCTCPQRSCSGQSAVSIANIYTATLSKRIIEKKKDLGAKYLNTRSTIEELKASGSLQTCPPGWGARVLCACCCPNLTMTCFSRSHVVADCRNLRKILPASWLRKKLLLGQIWASRMHIKPARSRRVGFEFEANTEL